jgi:hypothetical protein
MCTPQQRPAQNKQLYEMFGQYMFNLSSAQRTRRAGRKKKGKFSSLAPTMILCTMEGKFADKIIFLILWEFLKGKIWICKRRTEERQTADKIMNKAIAGRMVGSVLECYDTGKCKRLQSWVSRAGVESFPSTFCGMGRRDIEVEDF